MAANLDGSWIRTKCSTTPRRVIYEFKVPVCVEVEDDVVTRVVVIDETPVTDPTYVEGDRDYLPRAVAASLNGQPWPVWKFGY